MQDLQRIYDFSAFSKYFKNILSTGFYALKTFKGSPIEKISYVDRIISSIDRRSIEGLLLKNTLMKSNRRRTY